MKKNKFRIVLNKKYQPLFQSNSRYYVITGGRGSSKSYSVNSFLLLLTYEVGHTILFTRFTLTSAGTSIIPEFIEKIDIAGLGADFHITQNTIVNKRTGSSIIFKGIKTSSGNQTANLKSLNGVTTWVLDEAEELVSEKIFDSIDFSIRKDDIQNRVIMVLNPTTKEHFLYEKFFESNGVEAGSNIERNNCTYIHTTYLDNLKYLSQSFIEQAEKLKENNPDKYNHVILGGWLNKAEGVIYENWSIGEFQEVGAVLHGQDYGFTVDPTTLVSCSIDKYNKKIYIKENFYRVKLTTSDIYELNSTNAGTRRIFGDSAEPRLIEELKRRGNNIVPVEKGAGSVTAGISLLQDYELVIDPLSINIIKELNNYIWSDKKSGVPVDAYNHALDAVRYATYNELKTRQKSKAQKLAKMF